MQLGKLQPIQLMLPHVLAVPPGRYQSGVVGTGRSGIGSANGRMYPSLFSAIPTTQILQQRAARQTPVLYMHTRILLSMFKALQRLLGILFSPPLPALHAHYHQLSMHLP